MGIKFHRGINVKAPVMLVGWPGIGNVAITAVHYMRRKLGARLFAEVDIKDAYLPDGVIVNKGLATLPEVPKNLFYYRKIPPVVFFEGQVQLSGSKAGALMNSVLDLAERLKVKRILTAAAFPMSVSYREPPKVYVAATSNSLVNYFSNQGVEILKAGQISGLNGLMLGFAKSRGIDSACILATLPQYAMNFPNPRASHAVVDVICKGLGIEIDLGEMEQAISDMDERMAVIEDRLRELFPAFEAGQTVDLGSDKIPNYVMEKVEKLFQESKQDRKKATELKKELDRWDLYKLYEDRFLDLFKTQQ